MGARTQSPGPSPRKGPGTEHLRVNTGLGGFLGGFLILNPFLPQGPVGLKGDKGPPGPLGANVSVTSSAEWGVWWRELGASTIEPVIFGVRQV
jgi:hypothetical protein